MEHIIEYANEKFQSFQPGRWMLHDWDFFGMTYGFELLLVGQDWIFRTFEDSGYSQGKVILQTQDQKIVWKMIECFSPTNASYRTQRK